MKLAVVLSLLLVCAVASVNPLSTIVECAACHATIDSLKEYAKDPSHYTNIKDIVLELCSEKEAVSVCSGLINEFEDIIIDVAVNKYLDSDVLCVQLNYCTSPKIVLENFTDYVTNTMKGKPTGPAPVPSGKKTFTFAHLSDIHIDIYYQHGSDENCEEPLCCRNGTGNAGAWGTLAGCDLPLKTLEAALTQLAGLNPEFVIITGDFPPHDV